MPRYLSIRSKSRHVLEETQSSVEDSGSLSDLSQTSRKSKLRDMSAKATKGVKRQLRRLDDFLHHVTHTKHESTDEEVDLDRRRTVSVPSPVLSTTVPSFRVIRSRSSWYLKRQTPNETGDRPPRRRLVSDVGIQTTDEEMAAQDTPLKEENDLSSSEQQPSLADSTTLYVEADVPNPFLVDDEGDARSEQEKEGSTSSAALSPTHIPLHISSSTQQLDSQQLTVTSATLDVNKDVPPPPTSDEGEEEEELPDLYLPSLILPAMFLPIPNTDPLTTLLNKYIFPPERRPPRDSTGEWNQSDYHTLVMTNSWRALAKMARDQLVAADPSDLNLILTLWHLRLSCLARLRLFNQTSAECTNLFSVLTSIEPPENRAYVFDRVLPFELEVMYARLKYWAADHMGYLDVLAALLKKCRLKCRAAMRASSVTDATVIPMWKERGARVALIMASQMVEMKELSAATKLLEPLASQPEASPALKSSIARIYLQAGNIPAAKSFFAQVEADDTADEQMKRMNEALLATSEGDWVNATENSRAVLEKDSDNYVALNNLSVTLLNQGKAKEATEVLESALQASPSTVVAAEPFLFNLATLYELRATVGLEKKKELLVTAAKWSGDGLRTASLKMPAN